MVFVPYRLILQHVSEYEKDRHGKQRDGGSDKDGKKPKFSVIENMPIIFGWCSDIPELGFDLAGKLLKHLHGHHLLYAFG
jgi:hypothetical protein